MEDNVAQSIFGNQLADIIERVLEWFAEAKVTQAPPVQEPEVPPVQVAHPVAVAAERVPSYLEMMGQIQRMKTVFFKGGSRAEEADEWRSHIDHNFESSRYPEGYGVDLAVHYLEFDAHLLWESVAARINVVVMSSVYFAREFNVKYFPKRRGIA